MSSKTTFKRIALVAVAALGLGVLSVAPSSAAVTSPTLTLSGTTGLTAVVSESSSAVTASIGFFSSAVGDTQIVTTSITTSSGGSAQVKLRAIADSSNVSSYTNDKVMGSVDTLTTIVGNAPASQTYTVQPYGFTAAGTYSITVMIGSCPAGSAACTPGTLTVGAYATFSVVVTATSSAATSIKTYTASAGNAATASYYKARYASSTDSAVAVDAGVASSTYSAAAVVFANLYTAASETATGTSKTNICASGCTVNAFIDKGAIAVGVYAATKASSGASGFAAMTIANKSADGSVWTGETLTVYATGVAGVATIKYYLAANNAYLGSSTVTFVGTPASVTGMYSNETITSVGAGATGTLNATVLDSSGSTLSSGTVYLYSSDTKVAGSTSASAAYQSCSIVSGAAACSFAVTDTGTATLTLRDSTTVALSTWVSAGFLVTVTGDVAKTVTATFDKATYAPGDRAVLTITATDGAGRALATGSTFALTQVIGSTTPTYVTTTGIRGTASSLTTDTVFTSYLDSGVETRVITMPSFAGDFTYTLKFSQFAKAAGAPDVAVVASVKVIDPNAAAIAAAKDASDAATDAALEATDAAYAATDAANIAAEAADAATAAAEAATEAANAAKESADAATAAVEELATSVAKLMAALQAQITTLAKVVAKIAVKVKA